MINTFASPMYLVPPLAAFAMGIALAVVVLRRDKNNLANRLFSLVLVCLSLWGLFIFFMRASPDADYALFWDRLAVPTGIAMFVLYYHFTLIYTGASAGNVVKAAYGLVVAAFAFSAAGLLIDHMAVKSYGYAPLFFPAMYVVTIGGTLAMVGALVNLAKALRSARHHEYRTRLKYMIIAIALLFSFGILDIFPDLPPFGIFGNIVFGGLTAVAILRYHLLDINVAIRKGLAYFLISAIVAVPYVTAVYYFQRVRDQPVPMGLLVALLFFTAFVFNPLWQRIEKFVSRRFYRERYGFLRALEDFLRESHDVTDVRELSTSLIQLISRALAVTNVRLLLPDPSGGFSTASASTDDALPYSLDDSSPILEWLRLNSKLLYRHEIDKLPLLARLTASQKSSLDTIDPELLVPLKDKKNQLVGVFILGKKPTGRPYSYEDEQIVLQAADRVAIELENALLYEKVTQSERALRESETLFRTIVEASPSFLMIVDASGCVIYASPNCEQYTGYTPAELVGRITWWTHQDDLAMITESFRRAIGEDAAYGTNVEFRAVRKNGEEWYASASWRLLKDWKDETKAVVVQVMDVSDRKRMEVERADMQQKAHLASRLAMVGEMASGIAHEINNPLTAVIGFSELVRRKDIPKDLRRDIERINEGAQRVASIVNRLLTFARQHKPERRYISVNEVLGNTLALRAYEMATNNIELTTALEPDLPYTMADPGQLQQVFLNIIINAEKEMKLAHGKGQLNVKTERRGEIIRISFEDDGPGITEENMDKIFNPFFTTRDVGNGTGLGLSISHAIVKEHNGRIYARSRLGQGATFFVELPIRCEEEQKEDKSVSTVEKTTKGRILALDDETAILDYMDQVLSGAGYEVQTTSDPAQAKRLIVEREYDLILLDVKMPQSSGIQFYREIQEVVSNLQKKVIVITGDVMGEDTRDFVSKTGVAYLAKPFDSVKLLNEIGLKLAQSRTEK